MSLSCDKISYLSTNSFTKRYFSYVKLSLTGENMNNFASNFFLGLICTLFLFVLSVIITLGIKTLLLTYLDFEKKPEPSKEPKPLTQKSKQTAPKKSRRPKSPSTVVRSIEIDPEQIDKIYVKKTG